METFWRYYRLPTVQAVFDDARALGGKTYVLAGLSAGAGVSQFGALDVAPVRGVYLFGEWAYTHVSQDSDRQRSTHPVQDQLVAPVDTRRTPPSTPSLKALS